MNCIRVVDSIKTMEKLFEWKCPVPEPKLTPEDRYEVLRWLASAMTYFGQGNEREGYEHLVLALDRYYQYTGQETEEEQEKAKEYLREHEPWLRKWL